MESVARQNGAFPTCALAGGAASRAAKTIRKFSFDHLIRAQQNRRRYGKPERCGGLAVYDHLEPGRKLHRKIARLFAAQDAIHISGGATEGVYRVDSSAV